MTPQNATVQLRIQNNGTLTAKTLQITDEDSDFWDGVDFASFGSVTPPAAGALARARPAPGRCPRPMEGRGSSANQLRPSSPALPAGVAPADVRACGSPSATRLC